MIGSQWKNGAIVPVLNMHKKRTALRYNLFANLINAIAASRHWTLFAMFFRLFLTPE
jgi:hypothetical protein